MCTFQVIRESWVKAGQLCGGWFGAMRVEEGFQGDIRLKACQVLVPVYMGVVFYAL